jgi:nitronate monooxygenase
MWPDRRVLDLLGIALPILQAPMANFSTTAMAIAVAEAGGLGSLGCAALAPAELETAFTQFRAATRAPLNANFFTHTAPVPDAAAEARWRARLAPYYRELGLDPDAQSKAPPRLPFDADACALVERFRPEVVSFHFGLPPADLFARVKRAGATVIASATTVAEARWLEEQGCDAVIAMGVEAGGHRGNFLTDDMSAQVGVFALVPQVVDAVRVPVIAAGGIADGRGIAAAYLFCPEARTSAAHRNALDTASDDGTALTNLFSGRPARGIVNRLMRDLGPLSDEVPAFPLASSALAPLRAKAESAGDGSFSNLWSGQAARLAKPMPAGALTRHLAEQALARLKALAPR